MFTYYVFSSIINFLTSGLLAVALIRLKTSYYSYVFINLVIAIWALFYLFWQLSGDYNHALIYTKLLTVASVFMPFFFFRFALDYTGYTSAKILSYINNLSVALFSLLSFSPLMVKTVEPALSFLFWPKAGLVYPLFLVYFIPYFFISFYILIKYGRNTRSSKYFIAALIIGFVGGASNFPLWFDIPIVPFGNIGLSICVLLVSFGAAKFELLDVRLALSRVASQVVAASIVSVPFLYTLYKVNELPLLSYMSLTCFLFYAAVLLFSILSEAIHTPIQKKFLLGFYDIQSIILKLSSELKFTQNEMEIMEVLSRKLEEFLESNKNTVIFSPLGCKHYSLYKDDFNTPLITINVSSHIIDFFKSSKKSIYYSNLSEYIQLELDQLSISNQSLLFPIHSIEKFHGIFILGSKINKKSYRQGDVDLVNAVIKQLLSVFERVHYQLKLKSQVKEIEEKRKIDKDLKIASQIQSRVLPKTVPSFSNYHFSANFYPARHVSGDYYDFFKFSDTEIGIVVADIVGKGIPAAFHMITLNNVILQSVKQDQSPSVLLSKLNYEVCNNRVIEKYVPLIYGVLDICKNTFTYSNAGHEPGLHLSGNVHKFIDVGGPPLGFETESVFEEEIIHLNDEDILMLFTDGLYDARDKDEAEFGEDNVLKCVKEYLKKPLQDLALNQHLCKTWKKFMNGDQPQKDDMTLITIQHQKLDLHKANQAKKKLQ